MNYLDNHIIIDALYSKINSKNDKFKISKQRFNVLFEISPTFYLYEYCSLLEQCIYNKYNETVLYKYLYILDFIKSIMTLFFSPINSNSCENEYTQLYSYLNIINVNRSQICNKKKLRDKLFKAFLFTAPSSEEVVTKFHLSAKGIYYRKENINQIYYEIINLLDFERYNHKKDISVINDMLTIAYKYLTGDNLLIPYYKRMDIYAHYFFNPLDFINLYTLERSVFYKLLNNSVLGSNSFMKKSFIYNLNLFIISTLDDIKEIQDNVENYNKIIPILLNSNLTLPNNTLRDIKLVDSVI